MANGRDATGIVSDTGLPQALRAIAALMVLAVHIRPDLLLFGAGVASPDLTAGLDLLGGSMRLRDFATLITVVLVIFGLLVLTAAVAERRAFVSTLTADEAARLRDFCIAGGSWRDFATLITIERGHAKKQASVSHLRRPLVVDECALSINYTLGVL